MSSTSAFPIDTRLQYGQSYDLVRHLVDAYGVQTVLDYVRSFGAGEGTNGPGALRDTYRARFAAVFGVPFATAVAELANRAP